MSACPLGQSADSEGSASEDNIAGWTGQQGHPLVLRVAFLQVAVLFYPKERNRTESCPNQLSIIKMGLKHLVVDLLQLSPLLK